MYFSISESPKNTRIVRVDAFFAGKGKGASGLTAGSAWLTVRIKGGVDMTDKNCQVLDL